MDWSALAGPAVSVLGGFFGQSSARDSAEKAARMQFEYQKALNEQQNAFNVENYMNRYRWARADMRAAGLNPILAATSGIGGSIAGASAGQASLAVPQTPDFGSMLGSSLSSAYQTSSQKEIAKMQNQVAKEGLVLEKLKISNAKEKQDNDIKIDNARFDLEKMVQEASVKRADALNDATIQNMKDRLEAEKEHWDKMDLNGAAMAAAAMQSANAAGLQAVVAAELGISKQDVMKAEEAYIGLQSANAEEALHWQKWLNAHPHTRGAVGFIGAMFDTIGLFKRSVGSLYSGIKSVGVGDDW